MASQELVAFTPDTDQSDPVQVAQGNTHTLIPIFHGNSGSVVVNVVTADGSLSQITRLSTRPASNKIWQVHGPVQYIVQVRNAGCDYDTGA